MGEPVPVYLVRHGEAAAHWGQSSDPGLSELGKQQAAATAAELKRAPDLFEAALLSSPLARARETAEPFARLLGSEYLVDDAFREIPAPVPLPQRRDWLRGFMRQRWSEQRESELLAWRTTLLDRIHALQSPTVIFTHFLVINTIVGAVQREDATLRFWPDNASITQLSVGKGGLEIISLGREMNTVVN